MVPVTHYKSPGGFCNVSGAREGMLAICSAKECSLVLGYPAVKLDVFKWMYSWQILTGGLSSTAYYYWIWWALFPYIS